MWCLLLTFLTGCAKTKVEYRYYPLEPIYCHRSIKTNRDVYTCFDLYKSSYISAVKLTNPTAYK